MNPYVLIQNFLNQLDLGSSGSGSAAPVHLPLTAPWIA